MKGWKVLGPDRTPAFRIIQSVTKISEGKEEPLSWLVRGRTVLIPKMATRRNPTSLDQYNVPKHELLGKWQYCHTTGERSREPDHKARKIMDSTGPR